MVTWAEAAASHLDIVTKLAQLQGELNEWSAGTVTGGPNGDGHYPFTQPDGVVRLIVCPAKLETMTVLSEDDLALLELADATSRGALAEANRKTTVFRQATAPEAPGYADEWVNTSSGNARKWYDGETWLDSGGGGGGGGGGGSSGVTSGSASMATGTSLVGSTALTWQTAVQFELGDENTPAGKAFIGTSLVQTYSNSTVGLYGFRWLIDDIVVLQVNAGGRGINELPAFGGVKVAVSEGPHVHELQYRSGLSTMSLTSATMTASVESNG